MGYMVRNLPLIPLLPCCVQHCRQESTLTVRGGRALRTVQVLSLHILNEHDGTILFEDEQILPDGRSRRRHVAVSEKLIGECGD